MKRFLKNIQAICLLATSFACFSCSPDGENIDSVKPYTGERVLLGVEVSTRGESKSDAEVQTIRAIVFANTNQLVYNDVRDVTSASDEYELSIQAGRGMNNIYFICNETSEMKAKLEAITSPSEIEELTYPTTVLSAPVPMYAKVENAKITANPDGTNVEVEVGGTTESILEVTVKRLLAKLSLTVIKNIPAGGQKFSVEALSYKVCRMPKYSNLKEGIAYPQDGGWREELKVIGSGTLSIEKDGDYNADYTIPAGVDFITTPDVYIPEHLPFSKEHPDYCTYLLIEAKCRLEGSSMVMNVNYKVDLGNNPPVDNEINRNKYYKIYATMKNLGAMGFYADIVSMDQIDIPVNWKPFEGYVIVSEQASEWGNNTNIWNNYSQYTGILKISKNKIHSNVLFRYGSVVALSDAEVASDFNPNNDVIWKPTVTDGIISAWNNISYIPSGNIADAEHTLENIKLGKGDPCRLVGLTDDEIAAGTIDNRLWRMPTDIEMAWINTARNDVSDARGFYSFSYLLTPNSGYRAADGKIVPQNKGGYYWSSTGCRSFAFSSQNNTGVAAMDDPQKAYAIRCIRTTIHPSRFEIGSPQMIPYTGYTQRIIPALDSYNTPYWKMSVTPPAGDPVGDFTFDRSSGTNKESAQITVKQLPQVYNSRTYTITATGYGLDGVVHTVPVSIVQLSLVHQVFIELQSPNDLPVINDYPRLPAAGIELSFAITSINPNPYPPYNADFSTYKWNVQCKFYDNQLHQVLGTEAFTNAQSTVQIPPNNYGHPRAVEVTIVAPTFPPFTLHYISDHKVVFIQETN